MYIPATVLNQVTHELYPYIFSAWQTAFGNARLDQRYRLEPEDLPRGGPAKGRLGFLQ